MSPADSQGALRTRRRMTSAERSEQLIQIARSLFAERGFDGTSVEEIAIHAGVSKPVVYEHFGGKEGLYTAVVNREVRTLESAIQQALNKKRANFREIIELGTMALLDYIDACPEGFRIISRDSSPTSLKRPSPQQEAPTFASLLSDIAARIADILEPPLARRGYNPQLGAVFARGLVGLVASAGQYWLDEREPSKEELAAHLVDLIWNGLSEIKHDPVLSTRHKSTSRTSDPGDAGQ